MNSQLSATDGAYAQKYSPNNSGIRIYYHLRSDIIKLVDRRGKEMVFHLPQSRLASMKGVLTWLYPFYQKGKLRLLYQSPENETLALCSNSRLGFEHVGVRPP